MDIVQTSCQKTKLYQTKEPATQAEIQVSTFRKSLRINSFKIPENPLETGWEWQK